MKVPLGSLIVIVLVLGACAQNRELPGPAEEAKGRVVALPPDEAMPLWEPCTREQAEAWAAKADVDGRAALRAESCYVVLIREEKNKGQQLKNAKYGRMLAENTVKRFPESGLALYLAANLTALEAKYDPLRGLELVPTIEREALAAARLNPKLDHGGPDRLLGELYLRAPGFPVSIGDSGKAVIHYRRALAQDPNFPENRLGVVEALLADDENVGACKELSDFFDATSMPYERKSEWEKALGLLKNLCSRVE